MFEPAYANRDLRYIVIQ